MAARMKAAIFVEPNRIVLDAPVVTKDNVADFIDLSFES